jgi:hypothetical protein
VSLSTVSGHHGLLGLIIDGFARANRFRVFFLACAEFFAMDRGETWGLGHYLYVIRCCLIDTGWLTGHIAFASKTGLRNADR